MDKTYTSFIATDWDAIADHEKAWRGLVRHPNAHPDYVKAVIASRPEVKAPVLFSIIDPLVDKQLFMAIGRLEKADLAIDIGYVHLLKRRITQLTVIYGGLIGDLDETTTALFLQQMRKFLKSGKVDRVLVAGVKKDSPVWTMLGKTVSPLFRDAAPRFTPHWTATLPSGWSEYEKKTDGKHRSYLRRCEKKIAEMAGGETRVRIFTREPEIDELCRSAESIARGTYHRGIGAGFADTPEMRRRLAVCAKNGWMRGYVLYAKTSAIAFWLGTRFGDRFFLDFTGYLPDYSKQSPGLILFLRMVEDLYKTGDINIIDFGDGDAPYKQRFGDAFELEADAIIYAANVRMFLYSSARTIVTSFRRFADKAVPKGFIAFVKKQWRSKVIKNEVQQ